MTVSENDVFVAFAHSDIGRRSLNEDSFLVAPELGLLVVADGVGGHEAGEVASGITIDVVEEALRDGGSLEEGIRSANISVKKHEETNPACKGMATTVVAVKFSGTDYKVAWVGDSRAYFWDGKLKMLSRDHSVVETMVANGEITRDEARTHPKKNMIIQALGPYPSRNLQIGMNDGSLAQGEMILLCSDGMSDILTNAEISNILVSSDTVEAKCRELVRLSIAKGGKDNSTVVLAEGKVLLGEGRTLPALLWEFDPATGELTDGENAPKLNGAKPLIKRAGPTQNAESESTVVLAAPEQENSGSAMQIVAGLVIVAAVLAAGVYFLL